MTKISTSAMFDRRHPGLAARLGGLASSLFLDRSVTLCDASEDCARQAHTIHVERGSRFCLEQPGPRREFVYDDPDSELALAGLLARIAQVAGSGPIAADPQSLSLLALAERLAQTDVPVLITGLTGTGKEVMSRFIHDRSARAGESFIAINCAAIPEAMLEALLFGHVKGSFTGASAGGTGFFREADGGTLLLDEIAEMPLPLQAKLLRALQEGEVIPVGATRPVKVDVRVIACANRHLPDEVRAGRFREDLFYRLSVFPLGLLSLRERPADIAPFVCTMLMRHGDPAHGPRRISPAAMAILSSHSWPGNVRELENVLRRSLVLSAGQDTIAPEHIQFDETSLIEPAPVPDDGLHRGNPSGEKLADIVQMSEARVILDKLRRCNGKRADAARQLGISERTLRYRLASYREAGIDIGAMR